MNQINASISPVKRGKNPTRIIICSGNGYSSVDRMKSAAILNDPDLKRTFP